MAFRTYRKEGERAALLRVALRERIASTIRPGPQRVVRIVDVGPGVDHEYVALGLRGRWRRLRDDRHMNTLLGGLLCRRDPASHPDDKAFHAPTTAPGDAATSGAEIWADVDQLVKDGLVDESRRLAAAVLLAGPHVGNSAVRVAMFLKAPVAEVSNIALRLEQNGIWRGGKIHCEWGDEKLGAIAFVCDVLVAAGELVRVPAEPEQASKPPTKQRRSPTPTRKVVAVSEAPPAVAVSVGGRFSMDEASQLDPAQTEALFAGVGKVIAAAPKVERPTAAGSSPATPASRPSGHWTPTTPEAAALMAEVMAGRKGRK